MNIKKIATAVVSAVATLSIMAAGIPANAAPTDAPNPRHMWTVGSESESDVTEDDTASDDVDADTASPYARSVRSSAPYWGTSSSNRTFYTGAGAKYLSPAIKVLDVSEWNTVDWNAISKSGDIDAVILRAGYGVDNIDVKFADNLKAVRKYGIPFGVYWYSYAYDAAMGGQEGTSFAQTLAKYKITNRELTLPAFYDLEKWTWTGHTVPTSPKVYEGIYSAFRSSMIKHGYTKLSIYSYTNYLKSALASRTLWNATSWVAQYGSELTFAPSGVTRKFNWQYTSQGKINGVAGSADLSAFDGILLAGFSDVDARTSHAQDIVWLAGTGVTQGWIEPDGTVTFRGMHAVVRQDMAAFLYRLAGSPKFDVSKAKNPFADVNEQTPHYKEILWLASTGITTGWKLADGRVEFRGMHAVVRQDMAAFLNRYATYRGDSTAASWQPYDDGDFADVTASTPHRREVLWLASRNITTGWTEADGTVTFRGMNDVVRQDMAAFLRRMNTYLGK